MTIDREIVIRLAKECTAPEWQEETPGWHMGMDYLKFAALVLEHGHKPLTDEQRDQIYQEWAIKSIDEVSYDDLMLAVEDAHGITNKESSDDE